MAHPLRCNAGVASLRVYSRFLSVPRAASRALGASTVWARGAATRDAPTRRARHKYCLLSAQWSDHSAQTRDVHDVETRTGRKLCACALDNGIRRSYLRRIQYLFVLDSYQISHAHAFPHGTVRFTRQTHHACATTAVSTHQTTRRRTSLPGQRPTQAQQQKFLRSCCVFRIPPVTHTHRQKRETHADHHVHIPSAHS